jgi:xylono-1,5-lactonase
VKTMELELLASAYGLVECPRVDERDRLYFSDMVLGGLHRRNPDGRIETLVPERKHIGGLAFNKGGGLVFCGEGGVAAWDERTMQVREILTHWEGRPLQFNDMTPDHQGSIYAGIFGFNVFAHPRPEAVPGVLFRIDPPGKIVPMWEGIHFSNGLGFSPDRKLLYHSDSGTDTVWAYDIASDRSLKNRRPFAKMPNGVPDGLAVDVEGGIWVAAAYGGEVTRFRNDGTLDQQIKVPLTLVSSVVFGGADMQDLYIMTGDERYLADDPKSVEPPPRANIYRTRCPVPGLPVPKAQF